MDLQRQSFDCLMVVFIMPLSTRIKADKPILEKIDYIVKSSNSLLRYHDFKNSLSYLKISPYGKLQLRKINLLDLLFHLYWIVIVLITSILIPYLLITFITSQLSLSASFHLLQIITIEVGIVFLSSSRIFRLLSALKISKELNNRDK